MPLETSPDRRFLGLDDAGADPDRAPAVIVHAPYERTVTYGQGSDKGPRAILHASQEVELFDCVLGCETYAEIGGILTATPLDFSSDTEQQAMDRVQAEVAHWLDAGKFVLTIGGEHSTALGAVLAHLDRYPDATVVQIDAHSDLRAEYHGSIHNHACIMARVFEKHDDIVAVGIRSQCAEEYAFQVEHKIPTYYAHYIHANDVTGRTWIDEIVGNTRQNVYVTFDCDAFDPAVVPATGTPEPGGLTWEQVNAFLAELSRRRTLVGIDVTELAPVDGLHHPQFTIARLIYRLIGYKFLPHAATTP